MRNPLRIVENSFLLIVRYHFLQVDFDTREGRWSLDRKIYNRLQEKEETMLEAIDGGYLEGGYVDEEDIEIVLGDLFRLLGY